ncbi:MAG: tyrosine-type recombinase/integrase [Paracoccaceae bacterium]
MASTNKLTAIGVKQAKAAGQVQKLADGNGLYLQVEVSGSKLWRLAYRFGGKQKLISLGSYPLVSLADARAARDAARTLLTKGLDPSAERKATKEATNEATNEAAKPAPVLPTWEDVGQEFLQKLKAEGKAAPTLAKNGWLLERTYRAFGSTPIANLKAPELLEFLRGVEAEGKHDTATTLRALLGRVFRYGIASGRCTGDPAAALAGALITPPARHHPAILDPKKVGGILRAIRGYDGEPATRAGLLLLAYTFLRNGEVRHLEWTDIDFKAARISIPANRMKLPRPHIVPLSTQAAEVLEAMRPISGRGKLVLTSLRTDARPMSENTLNAALRRLGYSQSEMVPHGFRTIASTYLNEMGWNRDWIERQLAHVEGNSVRAAYNAAEYLEGRSQMMQAYADHLDSLADAPP